MQSDADHKSEIVTLGGGCFWCLEAVFEELAGVERVESGYTAGKAPNPTYEEVCSGTSGHAEVVQLTFDPAVISYRDILQVFFTIHDPTTLNRQGNDQGTQYRSAIYTHTPEQAALAVEVIAELNAAQLWDAPIVTEVAPAGEFFRAEDYHQEYYRNHTNQPYCQFVVAPKVAKARAAFAAKLKK
jgi:peptide-methionine (S)-S-oxide reductase